VAKALLASRKDSIRSLGSDRNRSNLGLQPGLHLAMLPLIFRNSLLFSGFGFRQPVQDELLCQAAEHALAGADKEILED